MDHTLYLLQNYWWLLISVLGALLVFLLFVQGGQSLMLQAGSDARRSLIANCMGRKWEITFTTLVTFGGAFFASFPLFYSTSFGGAYWLWMLILFSFILQAVSYEYRSKPGNVLGTRTYDVFLFINGLVGCVLLGVAVSMFFFGADFVVERGSLLNAAAPVISTWAPTHGFEAIFSWNNLVLGVAVFFLARTLGALYMLNNIKGDEAFAVRQRRWVFVNGGVFVVFFLWFLTILLLCDGLKVTSTSLADTSVTIEPFKYLHNYLELWWAGAALVVGVLMTLYGVIRSALSLTWTKGIWWAGIGVFLVVASLFWVAGYNDTAFYPSLVDPASSLTIRNASSSRFTLAAMSFVSIIIPFVLWYIAAVWRKMDAKGTTKAELDATTHKY